MTQRKPERTLFWRVVAAIAIPFLLLLARYRVQHPERIPASGAFVFAVNHYTNFDPLVTAFVLWTNGRTPRILVKASLFKVPVLGWLLRRTGQIPVQRAHAGSDPMSSAGNLVEDGMAVVIFPEGTLTRDPDLWPMRGKTGAVRTALFHDVPLVPAAHWGAQRVLPRYSSRISLFPRKNIDMIIGEPVDLDRWRGQPITPTLLGEATTELMNAITALVEQMRGETAPLERWDPVEHGQSETGRF